MNKNAENKHIEDILRKAYLPEPSPELKKRITTEAEKTWIQTSLELPWQIPVRRLIVSAAAAVLIIWLTNRSSDYALSGWHSAKPQVTSHQPPDLDALAELSYSPLARHLVSASRKISGIDASALRSYAETVRRILDESQQNGVSKSQAPIEGRSQLLPGRSDSSSYS